MYFFVFCCAPPTACPSVRPSACRQPSAVTDMFHIVDVNNMSSTLVETVSINYEDFNDSFLTCGTCLCMYDSLEHNPKLLPCSHTVCVSCLERIVAASRDSTQFRCPICRETIVLPRGGFVSFPPSFIVNQLLDLMAQQRRDIIPKCSVHLGEELMFCETCDTVFCVDCTGGSHNGRGASAHTVIPFSIAIKRMSEILLYKASLCMRNLTAAAEVVTAEMHKLDTCADKCVEMVGKAFQELMNLLDQRHGDIIHLVRRIRDDKKKVLKEQLDIIEAEKLKVQTDCEGLQQQIEVRNITKKISDLNEKLDVSTTLSEPRENAFMCFEYQHNSALVELLNALNAFGQVRISKTFPSLCSARINKAVTHLKTTAVVMTVDYHGNPRTTGDDPLEVVMYTDTGEELLSEAEDNENGTYTVTFTPVTPGNHRLSVTIFDRPIRDSPFLIDVTDHNNPVMRVGGHGSGSREFIQPVNVVTNTRIEGIYILDTGNSRITVLDTDGRFMRHLSGVGLEHHSTTGMALTPQDDLVVVNWRTKYVVVLSRNDGALISKFTSSEFVEPTSVTVNRQGEFIVADNGAGKVFVFSSSGDLVRCIGSKGDNPGQFRLISSVYVAPNDNILVTDNRLQVFTRAGKFLHAIGPNTDLKGQYGGVTIDANGYVLATRSEKGHSYIEVLNEQNEWLFNIDSFNEKLKRPSGLATTADAHVFVADLGNNCVKKYRYK